MSQTATQLDTLCINTIRTLSIDAVEKAKSGHPGAPMGIAPMAYVLWTRILKHNPKNPHWQNRDRFILSAGHASMLLYSLLHLTGYDISLEDIKNFRQWGSKTPGHPEYDPSLGIETTTGPLGQGFANAVGMAMSERFLSSYFQQKNFSPCNHFTYVIAGDGDLMEGISYEAASLAGHLKLGKLICLYDSNRITIDGNTDLSFTEDVMKRFQAFDWHVSSVENGNEDLDGIEKAICNAQEVQDKPSLILVKTTIGYGSPNKGNKSASHGAPLGKDEVILAKKNLGWTASGDFEVPSDAKQEFEKCIAKGMEDEKSWQEELDNYSSTSPDLAKKWEKFWSTDIELDWQKDLPQFKVGDDALATRSASSKVINAIAKKLPNFFSGSADLAGSVNTTIKEESAHSASQPLGRNICYGVREHAMGAIVNGMTLHGGVISAAGTFLIFSDYMKNSLRLAALMQIPSIFVFSHDSIGLGEDGPTHQPIEQIVGLRAIPNAVVFRPADASETVSAWRVALERRTGPTFILLSRQKLPVLSERNNELDDKVSKGGYVLSKEEGSKDPQVLLMATGSEVSLVMGAKKELKEKGVSTRVISLPSWELFRQQSVEYQNNVLPPQVTCRLAVEAASPMGWDAFVGTQGKIIAIDRFGASAPGGVVQEKLGMSVKNIVTQALELLK